MKYLLQSSDGFLKYCAGLALLGAVSALNLHLTPARAAAPLSPSNEQFGKLSREEFVRRHVPTGSSARRIRAADFLKGRTHSEAIEAAQASAKFSGEAVAVILDSQKWIIDRAILLSSNTELVIDGCTLKLGDGVFDNIIRVAGIKPNPHNPNGACLSLEPVRNIKISGLRGAVVEGADNPYTAPNPNTGMTEKWVGDFFGWRTVGILIAGAEHYEVSGLTIRKTHCWAISQESSQYGYLHDIVFHTEVKNGDGIDFRNGCAYGWVENISGYTSDDTVACTALDNSVSAVNSKYIWPMQSMGYPARGAGAADIHDIVIRNVTTSGRHHAVICLATSPSVYNITIDGVREAAASTREACVKIYTGYGKGYKAGNLRNIEVRNVSSLGAKYAVMVKADVKDVSFVNVRQAKEGGAVKLFEGNSENLSLADQ